jgi:hypothetical protein
LVSVSHACSSDGNKLQAGCTKKPWPQGDCLIDVLLSMASTSTTKQTLQFLCFLRYSGICSRTLIW